MTCNDKRENRARVSEKSEALFICVYIFYKFYFTYISNLITKGDFNYVTKRTKRFIGRDAEGIIA